MKPVVFLPEARNARSSDILSISSIIDYLSKVEQAVQAIAESPMTWPIIEGEPRRRLIRRFPFGILYRIEPGKIVIVAVAHLRRGPGYWRGRK